MAFVFFPLGSVQASEITPDKVISLVNDARLANKVGILVKDEALTRAAQMKADDIFAKGYFAHTSPEGKTPWTWFAKAGYDYAYAGENLAIHFTQAEDQQRAWMESPTHRKNILNPEYREMGVAVESGILEGKKTIVTVQEFGRRDGAAPIVSSTTAESPVISVSENPASEEKASLSLSPKETVASDAEMMNRAYERILLVFWGVMLVQVMVLGMIVFRVPKKRRSLSLVHSAEEDDREYTIPVTILFQKK